MAAGVVDLGNARAECLFSITAPLRPCFPRIGQRRILGFLPSSSHASTGEWIPSQNYVHNDPADRRCSMGYIRRTQVLISSQCETSKLWFTTESPTKSLHRGALRSHESMHMLNKRNDPVKRITAAPVQQAKLYSRPPNASQGGGKYVPLRSELNARRSNKAVSTFSYSYLAWKQLPLLGADTVSK